MQYPIKRRAAEFGVEIPAEFGSWQMRPKSAAPFMLSLSAK